MTRPHFRIPSALLNLFAGAALVLAISLPALAEIREIRSLREAVPLVDSSTVVILDLDNTIMRPQQTLGSDQWFNAQVDLRVAAGAALPDAIVAQSLAAQPVQFATKMQPVEAAIPRWIQTMQNRGIRVMALTARPRAIAEATFRQLGELSVDFTQSPIHRGNLPLEPAARARYVRGILFCDNNQDKGDALIAFLRAINVKPAKILFIDDKLSNVKSVEKALDAVPGILHLSLRYGYTDAWIAAYDPKIADIEWRVFKTTGRIISDEEAARMPGQPAGGRLKPR